MEPEQLQQSDFPTIVHPLDSSALPENVKVLPRKNGGWCYIIGTAHVSEISEAHTRQVIQTVLPDTVVIELCRSRVGLLVQQQEEISPEAPSVWNQLSAGVKNKNGSQTLHALLSHAMKSMTKDLKIQSGTELKAAAEEAMKIQAKILLGDRPIEITFKRTWARLSSWEKLKIFCAILYVVTIGTKISAEDVEKLKNGDIMTEMMEEMAEKFPGTLETIVHERDLYLTGR